MISDLVEMLDRQHAFMSSQQDVDLVRHLPRYVNTVTRDARIVAALDDLSREAVDDLTQINEARCEIANEIARLRDRYIALNADEDDRGSEHDARFLNKFGSDWRFSFRHFDNLVARCQLRWPDVRERDPDRDPLEEAISLLANRVPTKKDREETTPTNALGILIGNQQRKRGDVHRRFELHCFASPAVAAIRIRQRAARLTPPAEIYDDTLDLAEFAATMVQETLSFDGISRRVVFGTEAKGDDKAFSRFADAVRADLNLLHEELRARLALKRSLLTVVHRYRTRAQWYDAADLRGIARAAKRREDALTANFARYMHDQGLNPLTRPMIGPLQPDLFDPMSKWSFYVEAKQYSDDAPTAKLVKGMHQVWDTLGQQRGTPYEVREAFYIVFRMGGPRVVLPEELRSEGITVYPVVIDIADSKAMGSRQARQPVQLSEERLLPTASKH